MARYPMESRESVLQAVGQRWDALLDVGEVWRSDPEVVLRAVQQDGQALQFAAESLRGDRRIVLAAVHTNVYALELATEALRADREIVLAAVRQNAHALLYAAEALRADREVILTALQRGINPDSALEFAADCLLEDPTFATEAKRQNYLIKLTMLSGRSTVVVARDYYDVDT
eukprot:5108315-Amphidinium_carterae.1